MHPEPPECQSLEDIGPNRKCLEQLWLCGKVLPVDPCSPTIAPSCHPHKNTLQSLQRCADHRSVEMVPQAPWATVEHKKTIASLVSFIRPQSIPCHKVSITPHCHPPPHPTWYLGILHFVTVPKSPSQTNSSELNTILFFF